MARPILRPVVGGRVTDPTGAVDQAVRALAAQRLVVLVDADADAGHLVGAADRVSTQSIVAMATYGRGVLQVAMAPERLGELGIAAIGGGDGEVVYHVPVDLAGHDRPGFHPARAATVRALADPDTSPGALGCPGHVFPVAADPDGVRARRSAPEAAADLAALASGRRAAVLTHAVDEQGHPADVAAAGRLARRLGLVTVAIADVVRYRERIEPAVRRVVRTSLPTTSGDFTGVGYLALRSPAEYVAFVHGDPGADGLRVHIHDQCQAGDALGGQVCDCGTQLSAVLAEIQGAGAGVVVYFSRNDAASMRHLVDRRTAAHATREAEIAHLLGDLGVRSAILSSNEPLCLDRLRDLGAPAIDAWAPPAERSALQRGA